VIVSAPARLSVTVGGDTLSRDIRRMPGNSRLGVTDGRSRKRKRCQLKARAPWPSSTGTRGRRHSRRPARRPRKRRRHLRPRSPPRHQGRRLGTPLRRHPRHRRQRPQAAGQRGRCDLRQLARPPALQHRPHRPRPDGVLTVVALAQKAGVPRNALTPRHTDLKNEFDQRVKGGSVDNEDGARLRATIASLRKTIEDRNKELARLRTDVPALVPSAAQPGKQQLRDTHAAGGSVLPFPGRAAARPRG
jgi:hypothetical protein